MKVVRQIVYECDDQGYLDRQLSRSMPDGVRGGPDSPDGGLVRITVRTLYDERVKVDEFPNETIQAAGLPPYQCATCRKVRINRAIDQSMTDAVQEIANDLNPEYRPTAIEQSESESTEGAN